MRLMWNRTERPLYIEHFEPVTNRASLWLFNCDNTAQSKTTQYHTIQFTSESLVLSGVTLICKHFEKRLIIAISVLENWFPTVPVCIFFSNLYNPLFSVGNEFLVWRLMRVRHAASLTSSSQRKQLGQQQWWSWYRWFLHTITHRCGVSTEWLSPFSTATPG